MNQLSDSEKEKLLKHLSCNENIREEDIDTYIAEYVLGWTKIIINDLAGKGVKEITGLPWVYSFHTKEHFWLSRREIPNSVGKDFKDFHFAVCHFYGIEAKWDGIAWNVKLDKLEGGNGEKVEVCEASYEYALAKAAILAFAGVWNVRIHLSGFVKIQ